MRSAATSAAHDAVCRQASRHGDAKAVIGTDENGTVLFWNSAAEDLYGYSADEAIGRNIVDITPAMMSRRDAERIMHELLAGKSWNGDFTVRHRDGSVITVQVEDVPVMVDGAVVGIVGISSPR